MINYFVTAARMVVAEIPSIYPEPPPGVEELVKPVLCWVVWILFALCVGAVICTAPRVWLAHRRGHGGEVVRLRVIMVVCVIGTVFLGTLGAFL